MGMRKCTQVTVYGQVFLAWGFVVCDVALVDQTVDILGTSTWQIGF